MAQDKLKLSLALSFPLFSVPRGQRVCELWSNSYSTVAEGQDWSLPMQCLWPLSQDEWAEQAPHSAQEAPGKSVGLPHLNRSCCSYLCKSLFHIGQEPTSSHYVGIHVFRCTGNSCLPPGIETTVLTPYKTFALFLCRNPSILSPCGNFCRFPIQGFCLKPL